MTSLETPHGRVAIIKLGGSVFVNADSYRPAARFIVRQLDLHPEERLVVVVSAQNGITNALLEEAEQIALAPDPAILDLLWSTGEMRSVALLALHLQALGVIPAALSVQETGLRLPDFCTGGACVRVDPAILQEALARCPVVVVPGFLAAKSSGAIVSLGRGGSDLTSVLLAVGLGASRCELVKDVPGYFTDDPRRNAHALHLPRVSYKQALLMADAGCELVQRQALESAAQCNLPLLVRSLDDDSPQTWITLEPCEEPALVTHFATQSTY